jgi:hypothetical protein
MKIVLIIAIAVIGLILIAGQSGNNKGAPSDAELREAVSKIFNTCHSRVLGRIPREGEKLTHYEADAVTRCIDEMGGAYIAGFKAGR